MNEEVTDPERTEVNGYVQDHDGKWILTEEAKAASQALYYSGRIAYEKSERRRAIGRYAPNGEIIPFATFHSPTKGQ